MPSFDTPSPISAHFETECVTLRVVASDRTDTVVTVDPADPANDRDVRVAEQTTVGFAAGRLTVRAPRSRGLFSRPGTAAVLVELPAGSDVDADASIADYTCAGPLGAVTLKTSVGSIRVDQATAVTLKTDHGDVHAGHVTGYTDISGSGRVDADDLGADAHIRNTNGDNRVEEVAGDLRISTANGRIRIGTAHADVDAKSSNGSIRIGRVTRGHVTAKTAAGDVEIGIGPSTAAWLDLHTQLGSVRNGLDGTSGPGDAAHTVEVRARTPLGDITITRTQP
ncbi:DUF4097 family beta strand repeat-containing protein [Cryptosporangium phraense]|uniref:DUF4097 domain-containing protein n=1 Tax=Cryptosporangium phraense TaxID=2593070 RepID=A0A545ATK0_9ACTN|nr:DUF4097 family beta strand repeat-containing protein [Cryptosporangium phraense]TQS44656.1 DUF4097 domain-containing protein [Cryptosporangium phraense]